MVKITTKTLCFLISCLVTDMHAAAETKPDTSKVIFACTQLPKHIENYFKSVYGTAFAELGIDFEIAPLGLARAMLEAKKGSVDGLCGKIESFKNMPIAKDLIRIPVPILSTDMSLWALEKNAQYKTF
ncbi:hypothetical protein [Tenacibaculum sp. KUL113]|uniref:hypothetical protein n=1 Tax=Alteromonas sp. OM2203 TaxID=3398817 RepID=UPI0015641947